ncbi:MAG: MFS transporter [Micromonosporaceae bacterium]
MTTPAAPVAAHTALRHNRDFNLLWFGEGVSLLGNATSTILLPLLAITALDAGPAVMGLLAAAAWLPWLVVGLPAGAWVDGMASRTVMITSDLVAAVGLASVPVAWVWDVLTLAHLLIAAFLGGVCTVFFRTAYVKLIPQVAPTAQLEAANARLIGTESAMQVVGPGLGGALAQLGTAAWGLLLDVASFLVSAWSLWRIRPAPATAQQAPRTPLGSRISEGIRFVAREPIMRFFTVLGGLSNFGITGYTALLVLLLVREGQLEPGGVGLVMGLGSLGGLIGAVLATRISRALGSARALIVLQLLAGPPALLMAVIRPGLGVLPVIVGVFVVGIGVVAGNVIRGAWRQRYVPSDLMGRALTATQMVNFGAMPLGGLAAGWLGAELGLRGAVAVLAGVHAVACVAILWSPIRRMRDLPDQPRLIGGEPEAGPKPVLTG